VVPDSFVRSPRSYRPGSSSARGMGKNKEKKKKKEKRKKKEKKRKRRKEKRVQCYCFRLGFRINNRISSVHRARYIAPKSVTGRNADAERGISRQFVYELPVKTHLLVENPTSTDVKDSQRERSRERERSEKNAATRLGQFGGCR